MPTPPTKFLVEGFRLEQDAGQYISAQQEALAYVSPDELSVVSGEDIIQAALDKPDMPQTADALGGADGYQRLRVRRRKGAIVGRQKGTKLWLVKVRLEYELEPPTKGYPARGVCSLTTTTTPYDANGTPISYTYRGTTKRKLMPVYGVEAVETRETTELTNDPLAVAEQFVNKVNGDTWMGAPPWKWLCTQAEYHLLNDEEKPDRWRFVWEFRKSADPKGWRRFIYFIDQNGDIPADIETKGEGFKEVDWHQTAEFSSKFPPLDYDD
ncbi:MAG: hypothetical protein AMXMBFR13_22490 [Phycisphaerae bacterium]